MPTMRVQKRDGTLEEVSFDKVLARIQALASDMAGINPYEVTRNVCTRIYDGVRTTELDELAANLCSSRTLDHPNYGVLAARILVSNLHKETPPRFSEAMRALYHQTDGNGRHTPVVSDELYSMVLDTELAARLDAEIHHDRDYQLDVFGLKTLERSYLLGGTNTGTDTERRWRVLERPQYMLMRVALGIHGADHIEDALETYHAMSTKQYIHATPTLFNSGTRRPQMSSCFLVETREDSIEGIYDTLKDVAMVSKYAGGVGLHIHKVRAEGSIVRGTNGRTSGVVPMLRVFNNTARYVNQSSKRNGSVAVYVEPWHADIFGFIDLKKPHGHEDERARDLFYALWIPDLFMKRVRADEEWSLMCPDACPGLSDVWGERFEALYAKYETEGRYVRRVRAQDLWFHILESQMESGTPYMLFKDACNAKSNQQNLGTIKSSNLCTEIVEYTSPTEMAVCNLASLCLPTYVDAERGTFDHGALGRAVAQVTRNLNRVIDRTFYPHPHGASSNTRHRPVGIGVQGLADAFALLRLPFDSPEAAELNREVFATMYYAAMQTSMELARERKEYLMQQQPPPGLQQQHARTSSSSSSTDDGGRRPSIDPWCGAYDTFAGSPLSQGKFQFDLWGETPSARYDWGALRNDVLAHGVRNSLLIAPMPTASTSQIMGFNECFEPFTSNVYKRKTLAGEFTVVNRHLMRMLHERGMWTSELKDRLLEAEGRLQDLAEIPQDIRDLFKTAWDVSQKTIIDMAADRGRYVCQSQSMNLFMANPDFKRMSSMLFYAWERGLKTGMYYFRSKAKARAQKITVTRRTPPRPAQCDACTA